MASLDAQLACLDAVAEVRHQAPPTFREFAEAGEFCNLQLSPLIAAIMDASAGHTPTTIDDELSVRHFGCARSELPTEAPRTVVIRAGGRGGKTSRCLAPKAIHAAWTVPVPTLRRREMAYSLLFAPDLSLAHQTLSFVRGYVEESPTLSAALVNETADEIILRRPDGKLAAIRVVAASRGGKGGRGKTLVFAGMDEACFFFDAASGVVNDNDIYQAVTQRIVPGGQCWIVSTPWIALVGLLEELLQRNLGTHREALCAVAPTRALNPTWDPDGTIERHLRENDPDNATREIDAIPLTSGSGVWFDYAAIDAAVDEDRPLALPPTLGGIYGVGGDFGFKRDSSAQAIVQAIETILHLAALDEQRPAHGTVLKSSAVVDDFAGVLSRYGVARIACDSHERAQVAMEFMRHNVEVVPVPEGQLGKAMTYTLLRTLFREGRVKIPKDARLIRQLKAVTSRPTPGGGITITSPRQAGGGHGDLVSAFVAAAWMASQPVITDDDLQLGRVRSGRR